MRKQKTSRDDRRPAAKPNWFHGGFGYPAGGRRAPVGAEVLGDFSNKNVNFRCISCAARLSVTPELGWQVLFDLLVRLSPFVYSTPGVLVRLQNKTTSRDNHPNPSRNRQRFRSGFTQERHKGPKTLVQQCPRALAEVCYSLFIPYKKGSAGAATSQLPSRRKAMESCRGAARNSSE